MNKIKINNYPMINPVPLVIVGAAVDGKPNYAAVGAFGLVCLAPIFYVSLKSSHHTTKGVIESGCFSVNLPTAALLAKTDYCGMISGKDTDKSKLFTPFYDELGNAPMIAESPMNYLCKVVKNVAIEGFEVFFGEIVATYAGKECMTDGKADPKKASPVLMMGPTYFELGEEIGKAFSMGKALDPEII